MRAYNYKEWERSNLQRFWGEVATNDHLLQIYENERIFLDSLEGFIGSGLLAGDVVVVIARPAHLLAVSERLSDQGFDTAELAASGQLVSLNAREVLAQITINNLPDEALFEDYVNRLLKPAEDNGLKVRAFGEMVALLWEQDLHEATVKLEQLWCNLRLRKDFTLFCAYPARAFATGPENMREHIMCQHNLLIDGGPGPSTEIYYNQIPDLKSVPKPGLHHPRE